MIESEKKEGKGRKKNKGTKKEIEKERNKKRNKERKKGEIYYKKASLARAVPLTATPLTYTKNERSE